MRGELLEEMVAGCSIPEGLVLHHQPGVGHSVKDAGPQGQHLWDDLGQRIEGPKGDEPQAFCGAGRHWGCLHRRGVAQKAARQAYELLHKGLGGLRGVTDSVGQPVLASAEARGVGVADPGGLDRRGLQGEHSQPIVGCVARELHQDVHFVFPYLHSMRSCHQMACVTMHRFCHGSDHIQPVCLDRCWLESERSQPMDGCVASELHQNVHLVFSNLEFMRQCNEMALKTMHGFLLQLTSYSSNVVRAGEQCTQMRILQIFWRPQQTGSLI